MVNARDSILFGQEFPLKPWFESWLDSSIEASLYGCVHRIASRVRERKEGGEGLYILDRPANTTRGPVPLHTFPIVYRPY